MIKETAKHIEERFSQVGITIPTSEIESRLEKLVNEFKVPAEEAHRSVVNYFLKEYNIPRGDFFTQQGEAPTVKVSDITTEGKWINISAKVAQLWDNSHESIDQVGLIGDETGIIKFNKWAKAELPPLEEGKSYQFKNVVTDRFQERFQINFNRTSQIEEIQEDIEVSAQQSEAPTVKVSDITTEGKWINISAKVAQLWDNSHESIDQVGLIGDETGIIKFNKWAKAELPPLEEGKSYQFKNVVTDSYQERFQINFNKTSLIEEIQEDIEIGTQEVEFSGVMVDIQAGSGLIKRCPECNRALIKGVCGEHGKVEGTYDLRIKAVIDDGVSVQDALVNREVTEQLTSITLDDAKQMATKELDQEVVLVKIKEGLLGRYYSIKGPKLDRYILVENVSRLPPMEAGQLDALLAELEA
ncbi:MAG: replication protein A [ANME-2 cluster archaeon]|nr:replication protein A [ANME-2 cluster archaeon]